MSFIEDILLYRMQMLGKDINLIIKSKCMPLCWVTLLGGGGEAGCALHTEGAQHLMGHHHGPILGCRGERLKNSYL